jgi:serine/threonine protein kinase
MREVRTRFPRGKVVRERYSVEELLGQGGFGAVYRVRDRRVKGNVFALKEISDPNKQQRENFLFEGEVLRRLDHPYLPRVYRVFEDEKNHRLYMLMDYIAGPNLERLRQQQPERRFSLSQALQIMGPIMEAVSYLHAQQPPIIHRDIKPSNIIVPSSGEGAVLVDFGIAKEYEQDSTTTAVRHCSPGYGAPEQYVHGTNTQTDLYGLSATLYALLTGEVPIDALYRITRLGSRGEEPLQLANVLVPTIPQGVADALHRAMAVSMQDRFATVQEFWDTLRVYADEPQAVEEKEPAVVAQTSVTETPPPPMLAVPSTPLPAVPGDDHTTAVQSRVVDVRSLPDHPQPRRNRLVLIGVAVLAVLALFSGGIVAFSLNLQQHSTSNSAATTSAIVHQQQAPKPTTTTVPVTATVGLSPTAAPTQPPPAATNPPVQNITYPVVSTSYAGTIQNEYAQVNSTMALSQMQQSGASIQGTLTLGPGLLGSGPFDGEVTSNNGIHFLVPMGDQYLPLYFEGQFQANGSISGTYCGYNTSTNSCDHSKGDGYGSWQVDATGSQAQISSNQKQVASPFRHHAPFAPMFVRHS